jgi:hypothetical protein
MKKGSLRTLTLYAVCLGVLLGASCVEKQKEPSSAKGHKSALAKSELTSLGFAYWANETEILEKDWAGLIFVEVDKVREVDTPDLVRSHDAVAEGRVVDAVKLTRKELRSGGRLECGGATGVRAGDKLIIFLEAYDGGVAVMPVKHSGCGIGLRVPEWDSPLAKAVRVAATEGRAVIAARPELLKEWERVSPDAIKTLSGRTRQ